MNGPGDEPAGDQAGPGAAEAAAQEPLRPFFEALTAHLATTGMSAGLLEPTEDAPMFVAILELEGVGAGARTVRIEFYVPPGLSDPGHSTMLLQILASLHEEVEPKRARPLQWLTSTLNTRLPLGCFILQEEAGTLSYKQALMVLTDRPVEEQVRVIDLQVGMMIHMLQTFTDVILTVAEGAEPARALADHPMAEMFL